MDRIKSNAKINIGLNVLGKRDDGYHELRMIMAPIDFYDILELTFFDHPGNFKMQCNLSYIPTDHRNICSKIYQAFYHYTGITPREISLNLIKNVPIQAGLGGGSSNGAFFLRYLNEKHHHLLTEQEMIHIAQSIGADIPFFIINQTALVEGIGEKITPIKNNLECEIILIKPQFGVSTKEAYENIKKINLKKDERIDILIEGLAQDELLKIQLNIFNDIERGLLLTNQKIIDIRYLENKLKNINLFMSGSGSTYFTLVKKEQSEKVYNEIKNIFPPHLFFLYKTQFSKSNLKG